MGDREPHYMTSSGSFATLVSEQKSGYVVNAAPDDDGFLMGGIGGTLKQARSDSIAKTARYRRRRGEPAVPASAVGPITGLR